MESERAVKIVLRIHAYQNERLNKDDGGKMRPVTPFIPEDLVTMSLGSGGLGGPGWTNSEFLRKS